MKLERCSHTHNIILTEGCRVHYFSLREIGEKFCLKAQVLLDNDTVFNIDKQCKNCQDRCNQIVSLSKDKGY